MGFPLRFYLDEDVGPAIAATVRGLGLDAVAAQEVGQAGAADYEQLQYAAQQGRILVTFNRNDFIYWTLEFFRGGRAHPGVLILSSSLPREQGARIAHALAHWSRTRGQRITRIDDLAYRLDSVSEPPSPE